MILKAAKQIIQTYGTSTDIPTGDMKNIQGGNPLNTMVMTNTYAIKALVGGVM